MIPAPKFHGITCCLPVPVRTGTGGHTGTPARQDHSGGGRSGGRRNHFIVPLSWHQFYLLGQGRNFYGTLVLLNTYQHCLTAFPEGSKYNLDSGKGFNSPGLPTTSCGCRKHI